MQNCTPRKAGWCHWAVVALQSPCARQSCGINSDLFLVLPNCKWLWQMFLYHIVLEQGQETLGSDLISFGDLHLTKQRLYGSLAEKSKVHFVLWFKLETLDANRDKENWKINIFILSPAWLNFNTSTECFHIGLNSLWTWSLRLFFLWTLWLWTHHFWTNFMLLNRIWYGCLYFNILLYWSPTSCWPI